MRRILLFLLLATPAFAGTLEKLDLAGIDDDSIEIAAPAWDGSQAGSILVNTFQSADFDRTVGRKLGGGFRNAMLPSQSLASSVDVGGILAGAMRAEGRKLGLMMMEPQEGSAPQWVVDGTVRDFVVDIQHMGYGSLLFYAYLDVDVRVAKQGAETASHRIRPARLFVLYNGGMGIGDEAQLAMEKMLLVGAHQILARLNREHFHAPALPSITSRLASLKPAEQEGDLHLIGLSGAPGAGAALAAMLEKEKDENARTQIVYALTSLGAADHVPLLARRFASEDADVRYATIIALASTGTPEAMALIREKGPKDKTLIIRQLSERFLGAQ